jgi:hypothetical protein
MSPCNESPLFFIQKTICLKTICCCTTLRPLLAWLSFFFLFLPHRLFVCDWIIACSLVVYSLLKNWFTVHSEIRGKMYVVIERLTNSSALSSIEVCMLQYTIEMGRG